MYRRTLKRILLGWFILLIVIAILGRVSMAASNAGRTAADFLLIGVGARAAGMGNAFTAVCDGANAAYWNPSGLTELEKGEVLLGHFSWFQDITMQHGAVAYRMNDKTSVAFSMNYLGYGSIDGRDVNGQETGEITAYDWFGAVSLGFNAGSNLTLGLTGKFINQKLDELNGSTYALDLATKYYYDRFTVALVMANIGPDMKFEGVNERIPSSGRIGLGFYPFNESFLTSLEFEKRFYGSSVIRHGFEYGYQDQYFLRAGYNYYPGDDSRTFGTGLSLGAGVRFKHVQIDYAYTTQEKYTSEDLHRFSLMFEFGR